MVYAPGAETLHSFLLKTVYLLPALRREFVNFKQVEKWWVRLTLSGEDEESSQEYKLPYEQEQGPRGVRIFRKLLHGSNHLIESSAENATNPG